MWQFRLLRWPKQYLYKLNKKSNNRQKCMITHWYQIDIGINIISTYKPYVYIKKSVWELYGFKLKCKMNILSTNKPLCLRAIIIISINKPL